MSTPTVSVIMPAHNAAPFIAEAMTSVLVQSMSNLELIVVDDASTDETAAIVAREKDPRLRLLRSSTPLNAAGARNLALAEARGEFIAFLDADDVAVRTRLEVQLDALRNDASIAVVASLISLIDEHTQPCGRGFVRPRPADEIPSTLLFENCLALSSVTACHSALRPFRPDFAPAEDYDLWAGLAVEGARFHIIPDELVCYRSHRAGVSTREPGKMRAAVAAIHAAQAARLGLELDPIHALLYAWPLDATPDQVGKAEHWLIALRDANDRAAIYPRDTFRRVLAARWFQVCLDSWQLGWPVWRIFHRSPLAGPTPLQRLQLFRRVFGR